VPLLNSEKSNQYFIRYIILKFLNLALFHLPAKRLGSTIVLWLQVFHTRKVVHETIILMKVHPLCHDLSEFFPFILRWFPFTFNLLYKAEKRKRFQYIVTQKPAACICGHNYETHPCYNRHNVSRLHIWTNRFQMFFKYSFFAM